MSKQNLLRSESTASTSTSTSKKVPKNNLWRYVNISAMFSYVSVETKYFKDKQEALDFSYKDAVFNGYLDESFDWEKEDEDCPLDEEEESYRNKVEMAKEEPYKNEGGKYFFDYDFDANEYKNRHYIEEVTFDYKNGIFPHLRVLWDSKV